MQPHSAKNNSAIHVFTLVNYATAHQYEKGACEAIAGGGPHTLGPQSHTLATPSE